MTFLTSRNLDPGVDELPELHVRATDSYVCGIIRDCTFPEMQSTTDSGGAVLFAALWNSLFEMSDCQFTGCITTFEDGMGGAVYANVDRGIAAGSCCVECGATRGSYIAMSACYGIYTLWEISHNPIALCHSNNGEISIQFGKGPREVRNTHCIFDTYGIYLWRLSMSEISVNFRLL
jgi:hypothetical protein